MNKLFASLFVSILSVTILVSDLYGERKLLEDYKNGDAICGKIENEQLMIPSYKFIVKDKNGGHLGSLRAEGQLVIEEGVWTGKGINTFHPDARWDAVYHDITIPITYDSQQEIYVSKEFSKVKLTRRRKGLFPFKTRCWDKVTGLSFKFYAGDKYVASFQFYFPNFKINDIQLPNAQNIIYLEAKTDSGKKQ